MNKKEKKCKNCQLYNKDLRECRVVVTIGNQRINPPTEPEDLCLFEDGEIQEITMWTEDPKTGKPTSGNGKVKIQYPVDIERKFFWE